MALYPSTVNIFLPWLNLSCSKTKILRKTMWCFWRLWRNLCPKLFQFFNLPFTVSWRALIKSIALLCSLVFQLSGQIHLRSPRYPQSATTFSPIPSIPFKVWRNTLISGHLPQRNGQLYATMSPCLIDTVIS